MAESSYTEFLDLPVEDYNNMKAVRNSMMKHFVRSPRHYQWCTLNAQPRTKAMDFGTMFHSFMLDPAEVFNTKYLLYDEAKRPDQKHGMTAKENVGWKDHMLQKQEALGGGVYSMDELAQMESMKQSILANPIAAQLMAEEGLTEYSALWKQPAEYFDQTKGYPVMSTIEMKGRVDKLIPFSRLSRKTIVDIKTAENGDPDTYDRESWERNYHRAGAVYTDTFSADDFYLIVIEKAAPFVCCVYLMDESLLEKGRHDPETGYVPILNGIAKCRAIYGSEFDPNSKPWPGYEWKANADGDLLLKAPYYK